MTIVLKSQSQTLLHRNLSDIKKIIVSHQGGLKYKSPKKAEFTYSLPPEGNDCIFRTTCYLTSGGRCVKYVNEYWGGELPKQEIINLSKLYPTLKKVRGKPLWVDYKNRFQITLMKEKKVGALFLLIIKVIDSSD